jgi:hypothetical protein
VAHALQHAAARHLSDRVVGIAHITGVLELEEPVLIDRDLR